MSRKDKQPMIKCTKVVQVPLLPEYVDQVDNLILEIEQIRKLVLDESKNGYTVTIMFDPENGQYTVRLAGVYAHCENPSLLLYGNGETLDLAFVSIYIKHFLVSGRKTWVDTPKTMQGIS